jgi:hypothetical protein
MTEHEAASTGSTQHDGSTRAASSVLVILASGQFLMTPDTSVMNVSIR